MLHHVVRTVPCRYDNSAALRRPSLIGRRVATAGSSPRSDPLWASVSGRRPPRLSLCGWTARSAGMSMDSFVGAPTGDCGRGHTTDGDGGPAMASKCSPPRGLSPAAVPGGYCDGWAGAGLVDCAVVRSVVRSGVRSRNRPGEEPLDEIGRGSLAMSRHVVERVRQLAVHVDAQDRREISELLEQSLLRLRAWPGAFAGAAVPGGADPQVFDPLRFCHQVLAGGWAWWAWWDR